MSMRLSVMSGTLSAPRPQSAPARMLRQFLRTRPVMLFRQYDLSFHLKVAADCGRFSTGLPAAD
jgi:hypothetical protein